jgi:steroid delta-isomerase-like uncharacterized protein
LVDFEYLGIIDASKGVNTMSVAENKDLARRAYDMWQKGDLSVVDEIFDENYVNHQHYLPNSPEVLRGVGPWKDLLREFGEAFPDFNVTIEDQIAEGDKVVTRWTSRGTHKGRFMDIEPTDKQLGWTGISVDHIRRGKIVETWTNWDLMGMMQQLGQMS